MSLPRSFNSNGGVTYQPIEIDSIRLAVTTAELVEKINKGFKFSLGEPTMRAALLSGQLIRQACCPYVRTGKKVEFLQEAQNALASLGFCMEAILCAGKLTASEKARFDELFDKVDGQLRGFLSSQIARLRSSNARQSSDGDASGEISK